MDGKVPPPRAWAGAGTVAYHRGRGRRAIGLTLSQDQPGMGCANSSYETSAAICLPMRRRATARIAGRSRRV
ncbi:MAG: hypothetical protein QHH30_11575, partial [candidate division NC10 bacterium]|nr:hypothetical protein [candidate division NC10 bacterium]